MRVFLFLSLFLVLSACQQQGGTSLLNPKLESQKETLKKMSEALKKSGDMQSAAVIEQKLILLDQRDEAGFIDLSRTLGSIGKKNEAKDVLGTGVEVVPSSDKIKLELARVYLGEFDQKPAIEVLGKVNNKESKEYYGMMGVATDLEGNNLEAKEFYRKGLAIDAKDENIRNNLAMSYILSGEYGEAISLLEELTKDPYVGQKYKPKYRQNLALAYGLAGKNDKALKTLEKDLNPKLARENIELYKAMSGNSKATAKTVGKTIAVPKAVKPTPVLDEPEKPQAVETPEVKTEAVAAPQEAEKPVATSTKAFLGK